MPRKREGREGFSYNRVAEAPEYTPSPSDGAGYAPYVGITEAKEGDSLSYKDDSTGFKRVKSGGGYRNQMSHRLEDKKLRLTDTKLTKPVASGIRLGNSDSGVGFTIDVDAANSRFEVKDNTGSSATTPIVITGGDNNDGSINVSAAGVLTDVNDKFIQNAKFGDFLKASASGGQAGTMAVGQTGYDAGTGIFMGDVSGTFKFSLGNASGNKIRWTGSALDITGAVNVTDASTQSGTTTMTGGGITLSGGGAIKSTGKDNAADSTGGFFLGHDGSSSYDFAIGDGTNSLIWDGSAATLTITGAVTSTSGTIGGWTLASSTLSSGSGSSFMALDQGNKKVRIGAKASLTDSNDGVHLGTDGLALGASSVFKVTNAGVLTATSATITGAITSTSGTIGGWTLASDSFSSGSGTSYMILDQGNKKIRIGAKASLTDSNAGVHLGTDGLALGASSVFKVTNAGALTATNATITGAITATSGSFAGSLSVGSSNDILRVDTDGDLWIGNATQGSAPFQVTKAGVITATSGTVGGWTLSSGALTGDGTGDINIVSTDPGSTRHGIVWFEAGGDTSADWWTAFHDTSGNSNRFVFNYNGNNKFYITTDGYIESPAGNSIFQPSTTHYQMRLKSSDTANTMWYEGYSTDTANTNDHDLGGMRVYTSDSGGAGWNGYLKWQFNGTAGGVDCVVRAGTSGTGRFWTYDVDGASTNPLGGTTWDTHSDERVKENVSNVSDALTTLGGLRPITFNYTSDYVTKTGLPDVTKWGFIAQEFKTVLSEGVTEKSQHGYDDFHMLNTDMLVPILVKAVQELKAEVEALKS